MIFYHPYHIYSHSVSSLPPLARPKVNHMTDKIYNSDMAVYYSTTVIHIISCPMLISYAYLDRVFNRTGGFCEADCEISSPSTFSYLPHDPIRHVRHAGEAENRDPFEAVVPSGNHPHDPSPCPYPFPVLNHHPVP